MSAISLLSEMIAQGGKVSAINYSDHPAFSGLRRNGYLVETGVAASVVCDECDEAHTAEVVFDHGRYGYFCPDLGFVTVDREDLSAVQPDVTFLIKCLAQVLDCKKRMSKPMNKNTWRIGSVSGDVGEVVLYFHPSLQTEEDVRDLNRALASEVRADWRLIVTTRGKLPIPEAQSVLLEDLAESERCSGSLRILADPADLVGMPRKKKGGRPRAHLADLDKIILQRVESCTAIEGINAEAKAVLAEFKATRPAKAAPSYSTIKRRLKEIRVGHNWVKTSALF